MDKNRKSFEDSILASLVEDSGLKAEAIGKDISKKLIKFIIKNGINALFRDISVAIDTILLERTGYDFKYADNKNTFDNISLAGDFFSEAWKKWMENRSKIKSKEGSICKEFKYGLVDKPYTKDTVPSEPIRVLDTEEPERYQNILVYNRILSPQEIEHYNLVDLNEQTDEYQCISKAWGEYFKQLVQQEKIDDLGMRSVFEEK
jgi:hypothetical protein